MVNWRYPSFNPSFACAGLEVARTQTNCDLNGADPMSWTLWLGYATYIWYFSRNPFRTIRSPEAIVGQLCASDFTILCTGVVAIGVQIVVRAHPESTHSGLTIHPLVNVTLVILSLVSHRDCDTHSAGRERDDFRTVLTSSSISPRILWKLL